MAQTLYFTLNDLANVLGAEGVDLRLDDDPPATADADVVDEACSRIDEFLLPIYGSDQLAGSNWVRHRAKRIGAFLLCERRGNSPPPSVAREYVEWVTGPKG